MTDRSGIRFEFKPVNYEYVNVLDIVSKLTISSSGYDMKPMWVYKNYFFDFDQILCRIRHDTDGGIQKQIFDFGSYHNGNCL